MKSIIVMIIALSFLISGCDSNINGAAKTPFTLQFKAISNGQILNCNDSYTGFGPDGNSAIGIGDLRFFISNIRFYNNAGESIQAVLDNNEFQYTGEGGAVALIDFFSNETGYCATVAEATARTNTQITGKTNNTQISRISFDVGVPQRLMKTMVAAGPVEDAPSPLSELYWSWAGGYRHLVVNFTSMNADHTAMVNNSAFHIGSMDCGGDMSAGVNALTTRDRCGRLNTPTVLLDNFDLTTNTVVVDISKAFSGMKEEDISRAVWQQHKGDESMCLNDKRKDGTCVTGKIFGVQCHSRTAQPACRSLFPNFGIDIASGESQSASNSVFTME